MCPFCLGTLGLIAAGTASTGGLAGLVLKGFPARRSANAPHRGDPVRGGNDPKQIIHKSEERRNH